MPPSTQPARAAQTFGASRWQALGTVAPGMLVDARLQLHHAAQIANAAAMSLLPPAPDDSHTNLEWSDRDAALLARPVSARSSIRVGLRPADLTLLVLPALASGETLSLHGRTSTQALDWLRERLAAAGADANRVTLRKHYEIPAHRVGSGGVFDLADAEPFRELATHFANAAKVLGSIAASTPDASELRCWPHHFDLATLITRPGDGPRRTIGVGMEPGDGSYAEPYYYVGPYPYPPADALPPLPAGHWHTKGWTGAVLTTTELLADGTDQATRVTTFLEGAIQACRGL